jgi:hypothetical protein
MGVSRFFSYPIQFQNFNNLYKKSILIMQKVDWNWQYLPRGYLFSEKCSLVFSSLLFGEVGMNFFGHIHVLARK